MSFQPLSSLLIRRLVLAAVLCTLIAAAIQAFLAVREENAAFERSLQNIGDTHLALLSVSLWDIETAALRKQLAQITSQPEIAFARVVERSGHAFEAGDPKLRDPAARRFAIPYPDGRPGSIGTLEVSVNKSTLVAHVTERVLGVMLGLVVLSVVLCFVIVAVLRLELEKPMRRLAQFTRELTPDRLTTRLELQRPKRRWEDEIDLVANGFGTLQDAIRAHVVTLDQQVAQRTADLQIALDEITALTITDSLTGCHNRRHLDERLLDEVTRSRRGLHPLSVVIADIDHFKSVNDTLGHAAGDTVLRGLARIFMGEMRARIDWVARSGGEEFVIVLPDTSLEGATKTAERLRRAVEASVFEHESRPLGVTASFGVAQWREGDDAATLLARADNMLYRAKASGRNRVQAQ